MAGKILDRLIKQKHGLAIKTKNEANQGEISLVKEGKMQK